MLWAQLGSSGAKVCLILLEVASLMSCISFDIPMIISSVENH